MPTLTLNYPVIIWHTLEVAVTDEQALDVENMSLLQQAQYIEQQHDLQQVPYPSVGIAQLDAALDVGYATIKRLD